MKSLSRFTVLTAVSSLVLGIALLSVGCQSKTKPADGPISTKVEYDSKPNLGNNAPAAASETIRASQASGKATGETLNANGAAGGAASNGWR